MAQIVPAMKAYMGNTEYYIISLKAGKLIQIVKTPKEIDGWDNLSLEEQYQRDINIKRVREQLAPYWANRDTRFFGSIIVAGIVPPTGFDPSRLANEFEPIGEIATKNLPKLYTETAKNIGFLTLPDEMILVPLDGQHRVKAIEYAIIGKDGQGKDIPGIRSNTDLANEDISVLLVAADSAKARSIFTHVNRYAKPTTAGQNYITSDDDICAVLAREITNEIFTARLVKYTTNTLTTNDPHFTTLATLYNCTKELAQFKFPGKLDVTTLPPLEQQDLLREQISDIWNLLVDNIEDYKRALADKSDAGDDNRRELRKNGGTMLSRPVMHEHVFKVFLKLTSSPTNYGDEEAIEKINGLPWDRNEKNVGDIWQNVLWSGDSEKGRVITRNRDFAVEYIFRLAGGRGVDEEALLTKYRQLFPEDNKPESLPPIS